MKEEKSLDGKQERKGRGSILKYALESISSFGNLNGNFTERIRIFECNRSAHTIGMKKRFILKKKGIRICS
ncbi:hypothetical protein LEP1GSC060_1793 [Leptospira weilii serovar Ranarum str. ICFT]|uniref:Uncharacterized protein n=1 Tax=Leptospira weilii serovar Ranarum str. ICFT TaxID=1218598 RepID=N1WGR7_9LEPT|nr:hypothetical protein [Leptospira weilii]EMY78165.1 hypothetical protein LEP1GSC060_1793 [Leptospira weilii serovar Ranarum str. ICFT]